MEGNYYWSQSGWLVGPLKARDGGGFTTLEGFTYREDLTNHYGSPALIPEPVDIGEPISVKDPVVGSCVLYNGKLFWVTRKDFYDIHITSHSVGYWYPRSDEITMFPKVSLTQPAAPSDLEGKWVWHTSENGFVLISDVETTFDNPKDAIQVFLRYRKLGSSWSYSHPLSHFDIGKVVDVHPREASTLRHIQGQGKYVYGVHKGEKYLVASTGYGYDYHLVHPVTGHTQTRGFSPTANSWYDWELFYTDELPFSLPLDPELCYESVRNWYTEGSNNLHDWLYKEVGPEVRFKAILLRAKMATNTRGNIALYLNDSQVRSGKIQSLRPGRALRVLIPDIKDAELEKLVDKFRANFPAGDYVIKRGFEAENFVHMYSHAQAPMQNPATTTGRKSLSNSCMRHDFSHLPHHPCEAYASGEFEAFWTEDPNGRIASRLVVWHPPADHHLHGKPQCGPVYGTCEYSIDLLQNLAKDMGADLYTQASWSGAKWKKFLHNGGVIAPYCDHEQSLEDIGDWLLLGGDCDYEADDYSGVLGARGFSCDECGDHIDEEYDSYEHIDGVCVCEHCRDRYFFYCEEHDRYYRESETASYRVYVDSGWGAESRTVCEDALSNYILCEDDEEYWHESDVTMLANGEAISPRGVRSGDYAACEGSGEWYSTEDMYPLRGGGYIAKENYDDTTHAIDENGVVYEREAA